MNKIMTCEELSEYLAVPISWLRASVSKKQIPNFKLGRLVRFRSEDIKNWLEKNKVTSENALYTIKEVAKICKEKESYINLLIKERFTDFMQNQKGTDFRFTKKQIEKLQNTLNKKRSELE